LTLLTADEHAEASPRDVQLIAALRGKLLALAESGSPAVAPTAAQQQEKAQP
jgi:hypothetical protein